MRLIGYGFVRGDAPARVGYLSFDDLTVLVGANDTGKSRLLEALAAHLAGTTAHRRGAEAAALYLELEAEEVAHLAELDVDEATLLSVQRRFGLPHTKTLAGNEAAGASIASSPLVALVEPLRPH